MMHLIGNRQFRLRAAWKLGVQLALSAVFVGMFCGVLFLGAALFNRIGLHFLSDLIEKAWFALPASALATAAALHLTDVRARLVAGIRQVVRVLLSWLLPLMALLAAGFLVSLVFTGLEPLWTTRSAAALLLTAAAALVFLINAAWQDGPDGHTPPAVLRIGEHGWSETRIYAVACIVVAACYALGYGWALIGGWCAPWPAHLESRAVPAAKFDYAYLRHDASRFGREAPMRLAETASGPNARTIRGAAKAALATTTRTRHPKPTRAQIAAQLTVYPKDYKLPESLLAQDWSKEKTAGVPPCLQRIANGYEVFPAALAGSPPNQLTVTWGSDNYWNSAVLGQDASGHWSVVGRLSQPHCKGTREALRKGQYEIVPPAPPRFRDLHTGARRFRIEQPRLAGRCQK